MLRFACFVAACLVLPCSGCMSAVADLQAGPMSSTRFADGRYGGAAQVAGGFSIGETRDAEHFGPGADLRMKIAGDVKQVGIGPHVYWLGGSGSTPYARGGATLAELGSVDGDFSFGALGPRAEIGMFFSSVVVSTFAEYDLRWTHQDNEGFVGLMLGVGSALSTAPLHADY